MRSLQDLSFEEVKVEVQNKGFPSFRAKQIYDMLTQYKSWSEVSNIPDNIKDSFKDTYLDQALSLLGFVIGKSKTKKYLFKTYDGHIIESVYISNSYGCTVCVSTQVGCRMGCTFCASGKDGLARNLSAGEILSQVLCVNRLNKTKSKRGVANIVLMGSGEPLDNYDNVKKFIELVNSEEGLNISKRNITISTCGLADKILKLADDNLGVNLSISLHSSIDSNRRKLMPVSNKYTVKEILYAADYFFEKTGRRVSYEYALMYGENSTIDAAKALGSLLQNKNSHVNVISVNKVEGVDLRVLTMREIQAFMETVSSYGVPITLRKSKGDDIEGACGQLKRRYIEDNTLLDNYVLADGKNTN